MTQRKGNALLVSSDEDSAAISYFRRLNSDGFDDARPPASSQEVVLAKNPLDDAATLPDTLSGVTGTGAGALVVGVLVVWRCRRLAKSPSA